MKKQTTIIIVLAVIVLAVFVLPKLGLFAITGGSTGTGLTRSIPTSVQAGQTFVVTYSTVSAPSSKYLVAWVDTVTGGCTPGVNQDFFASDSGGTLSGTKTFTAPQTGSCTFKGNYQYAGGLNSSLPTQTITVLTCKTVADTNCNGVITFAEITVYAQKWLAGTVSFNDLINVAGQWTQ